MQTIHSLLALFHPLKMVRNLMKAKMSELLTIKFILGYLSNDKNESARKEETRLPSLFIQNKSRFKTQMIDLDNPN